MSIKNNIIKVLSANLFNTFSGIILGFIIPVVLSLGEYSKFKTYTLILSYIAFLPLGFIDGIYIKYGGKSIEDLNKSILKAEHNILISMQVLFAIIFMVIGIICENSIILLISLSIVPYNICGFYKLLYQATGEFKKFTKIFNVYTIFNFSISILFAVVLKFENYLFYCLIGLIVNSIIFCILEYKFYNEHKNIEPKYSKKLINNFKIGIIILIANLGLMIFNAADLWFVKLSLSVDDFAYYSFAVSMLNVINVMIMSVSVTFYNYLAKKEDEEFINKLKKYFIMIGAFSSLAYFAFSMIVNLFIKKYIPSLTIIAISFAAFPYMIIIKGLFVNLYRARKDEKKYLKVMLTMVVIAIIYNSAAIILFKTKESIAYATLLAFITWSIYSGIDLKYSILKKKEIIYLSIVTISFLTLSNNFNWLIGGVIYLAICISMTFLIYKNDLNEVLKYKIFRR